MKTLQKQVSSNGKDGLTSLPADSLANHSVMPESEGAGKTTVICGHKCVALLTKSGRLGSSVKMLLESRQWLRAGYLLKWEAINLCSKRITTFTDTNLNSPLPLNESAKILNVLDIPCNRCLFRLRPLALPTDATASSSLRTMMLITPTSVQMKDNPEKMAKRKMENGYRNGTTYPNLEAQVKYDPKFRGLLPTPLAVEIRHKKRTEALIATGTDKFKSRKNGDTRPNGLMDYLQFHGMLPTPTARDEKNPSSPDGKRIARKMEQGYTVELNDLAAMGCLPTPDCSPENDGSDSRLSPLFVEEMMGFPYGWTTFPFLSQNGEPNH